MPLNLTKIYPFVFIFLLAPLLLIGQNLEEQEGCAIQLDGYALDEITGIPLSYATIFVEEKETGVVADSLGYFTINNLCATGYHLRFSHIGCENQRFFYELTQDTTITIYLHHHSELMDELVVHGSKEENSTQNSNTIGKEEIAQEGNKNLSDILENISGVSTLKNGAGLSKPVVHGLYGNRVSILNNGIAQSGQQWGNDHAPEIDPFVADHIAVIKGASALAYNGSSLGSVVLVETDKIATEPHLHGRLNYILQSNGWGHTFNGQIERFGKLAAWRLTGTFKQIGDRQTPNYYLRNTGSQERNIALQLEKKLSDHWHNSLYYSYFNTQIGVLRGSHIGNTTDLEQALQSDIPLYTVDSFTYKINAPKQKVQHHLLKLHSKYFITDEQVLNFIYSGQINNRKEFDIRRGGRSNLPALSLLQLTHFLEGNYQHSFDNNVLFKTGLQLNYIDNTNNPETDILPLIPDYRTYQTAAFAIFSKSFDKLFYEIGGRYDYKNLEALTISRTIPREVIRYKHNFHNYSFSTGLKYQFSDAFKSNFNIGYVLRNPEVNELYSAGLHQGVSGIEEGNPFLNAEKSLKTTLSGDWSIKEKLFFQILGYFQNIQDYIYLNPEQEFRLTIRGAFPVFTYKQANAQIYGTDFLLAYEPIHDLKFIAKYAFINGQNKDLNIPLINIPANNLFVSGTYALKDFGKFNNSNISVNARYVFEQNNLLAEQDFLPPPSAYFLLGINATTNLQMSSSSLKIHLKAENILNEIYRDYLNRQRYFADDLGINISLGLKYDF